MKLRRLNAAGIEQFSTYLGNLRTEPTLSPPTYLLSDDSFSEPASDVEVAQHQRPGRRIGMRQHSAPGLDIGVANARIDLPVGDRRQEPVDEEQRGAQQMVRSLFHDSSRVFEPGGFETFLNSNSLPLLVPNG